MGGEQVVEGEWFVAVGAGGAGAEAAAEEVAVGEALLVEEPGLAARAFVDGVCAARGGRGWRWLLPLPVAALAAGVAAEACSSLAGEGAAAGGAAAATDRHAIVTHGRCGLFAWRSVGGHLRPLP